jgi:hypothetical protein
MGWMQVGFIVVGVVAIGGCGPSAADSGGDGSGDASSSSAEHGPGASASEQDGGSADATSSESGVDECPLPVQGGRLSATIIDDERSVDDVAIEPGSGDRLVAGRPCMQRVTADGSSRWTYEREDRACGSIVSTAEVVAVGSWGAETSSIVRLDLDTGALLGEVVLPADGEVGLAAQTDGTIYAVVRDGPIADASATMTAIGTDGQLVWTTPLPGPLAASQLPIAAGRDGVLVGLVLDTDPGQSAVVQALDTSGAPTWTWTWPESAEEVLSIAADATGIWVIVGDINKDYSNAGGVGTPGWIVRLDPEGQQLFATSTLDDPAIEFPRAVAADPCVGVYVAGHGSTLGDAWGQLWVARIDDDANVLWSDAWDGEVEELPDSHDERDGFDFGEAIAIDPAGTIVVAGSTEVREELDGHLVTVAAQDWLGEYAP